MHSGSYAGVVARGTDLAGPSALALLEDGGALVASYESSAIFLYNRSASFDWGSGSLALSLVPGGSKSKAA